jgi:PhoH-like ATPase
MGSLLQQPSALDPTTTRAQHKARKRSARATAAAENAPLAAAAALDPMLAPHDTAVPMPQPATSRRARQPAAEPVASKRPAARTEPTKLFVLDTNELPHDPMSL